MASAAEPRNNIQGPGSASRMWLNKKFEYGYFHRNLNVISKNPPHSRLRHLLREQAIRTNLIENSLGLQKEIGYT